MARQEVISVFSDGLMTDLNPINTPKSVLTDCLNGTLVTYNGNEFILQNDMGNYKLENCKLPTNFIPVGIKGYADILYIVSYNPISKEVEIGSYPAPQSIFVIEDQQTVDASDADLCPFYFGETVGGKEQGKSFIRYNDIIDQQKHPLFIFIDGANEDTYKLYPGDEFKLDKIDVDYLKNNNYFIYQHLNFYVIDSDNKLYDLDDAEIYSTEGVNEQGFKKVFWETPGWLAAQYDLFVPDKFNLNVRSMTVPSVLEKQSQKQSEETTIATLDEDPTKPPADQMFVSLDLSAQTIISDELFQQTLELDGNQYKHLYTRFLVRINNTEDEISNNLYGDFRGVNKEEEAKDYTPGDWNDDYNLDTKFPNKYKYIDINCQKHNYQDDIITAFNNLSFYWWFTKPTEDKSGETANNFSGYVEVTAFPIIKYNNGTEKTLEYTQFASTISFDLNNLPDSNDITIGDSIYKWAVDDDSCTVSFNILGPFINTGNMIGKYEIYRVNKMNYVQTSGAGWDAENNRPTVAGGNSQSTWSGIKPIQNLDEFVYLNESGKKTPLPTDGDGLQKIVSNDTQVLVAKGDIPNLILFGQNTINIDFKQANVLELTNYRNWYFERSQLNFKPITRANPINPMPFGVMVPDPAWDGTTSKNLTFEKEGGVYKLRIILNDGTTDIISKDLDLIPSEVFNTWFGSVDNYLTSITGTMWVNRYLETVNITDLNLNDTYFDFSTEKTVKNGCLEYKWSDEAQWNPLAKETLLKLCNFNDSRWSGAKSKLENEDWVPTNKDLLNWLFALKFPDNTTFTINSIFELQWKESTNTILSKTLSLRINLNLLDSEKTLNWTANSSALKGNLWNPIYTYDIDLYNKTDHVATITLEEGEQKLILNSLDYGTCIFNQDDWKGNYILSYNFPFLDAFSNQYTFNYTLNATRKNYKYTGSLYLAFGRIGRSTAVIQSLNVNSIKDLDFSNGKKSFSYNMGTDESKGQTLQQEQFGNTSIAIAGTLSVDVNYIDDGGAADRNLHCHFGPGSIETANNYDNSSKFYSGGEYHAFPAFPTKGDCVIVKLQDSNYSVMCSLSLDKILQLCAIKYLERSSNSQLYFPQMLINIVLEGTNYNWTTTRYISDLELLFLRCDDSIWNVNKNNENLLFKIDSLNRNKTITGNTSSNLYVNLEENITLANIKSALETILRDNTQQKTNIQTQTQSTSEYEICTDTLELNNYLHGDSIEVRDFYNSNWRVEKYSAEDIIAELPADTKMLTDWYNGYFTSIPEPGKTHNISSIRFKSNVELTQAYKCVFRGELNDPCTISASCFYFIEI